MRLGSNYKLCTIAGQDFLVPIGNAVIDVNSMLDLNEQGAFIIHKIQEKDCSIEELENAVFNEYDAPKEQIKEDLNRFIKKGIEYGFII